jgi:UDP-N-acetylmuramoylalanine--D-glutamate ligase
VILGSELAGKRVLVMGLARSGRAAAQLARDRGARVVGVDLRTGLDPIDGVVLELGPHRRARFEEADLVVVSPGIPAAQADLRWAVEQGKDVVGELGFALRFLRLRVVAITGTNGKSTVTHFTGQLLRAAGFRPFVGGNLGTPLCEAVEQDHDVLVLEVSSYQLELPGDLQPAVAVILNLTPEHLGRHGSMDGYAAAKAKLFARMTADQVAVLPVGDDRLARAASGTRAFRAQLGALPGVVREARRFRVALDGLPREFSLDGFAVPGDHNLDNAATATLLAVAFGADPQRVQAAIPNLTALAHRMQVVADADGVQWIDDSKATDLDAARVGIEGLGRPAVVLLGGQGKAMPDGSFGFGVLAPALGRHRAVVAFGQDGPAIAEELAAAGIGAIRVARLADAVQAAAEVARPGDAALLSPGCASFDEFRDFEHRGDQFAAWVHGRTT